MSVKGHRLLVWHCSRKNFKVLFSAGIALAIGVRIYIFHAMRMTDAILPGSPPPGNIKRLCIAPSISFRFLFASSKDRLADMWENIPSLLSLFLFLSLYPGPIPTADRGTFHLERAHSIFAPLFPLGDHSLSLIPPS